MGSQKVTGSRLILRALDGLAGAPMLPDPGARDEADAWGDDVLQHQVRWIAVDAVRREPSVALAYGSKSAPPLPDAAIPGATKALFTAEMRAPDALGCDEYVPALAGHLDHVDALIADGVLGGDQPNVADCQIAGASACSRPSRPARGHRRPSVRGLARRCAPTTTAACRAA